LQSALDKCEKAALAKQQIEQFRERVKPRPPVTEHTRRREHPQAVTQQPSWLVGGKLYEYQLKGLEWLMRAWADSRSAILGDEMGLGKTVQALGHLSMVRLASSWSTNPSLVVVPLSTLEQWAREMQRWCPHLNVVQYIGSAKSREIVREYEWWEGAGSPRSGGKGVYGLTASGEGRVKFDVLLTTYEMVLADRAYLKRQAWQTLVVDEAHRLKNKDSELFVTLHSFSLEHKLLVTGTPMQNSTQELWCLLHFLDPNKFSSVGEFISLDKELVGVTEGGKKAKGQMKNLLRVAKNLDQELSPHLLRRTKKMIDANLPPKTSLILPVPLSLLQRKYYRWILGRQFSQLNQDGHQTSLLNVMMELKKVCNHPFLFENARAEGLKHAGGSDAGYETSNDTLRGMVRHSGKMVVLDKLLRKMKENGHRCLIFSQMVRMLDILSEYLVLRGFRYQRIDGNTDRTSRQMAMDHFNAPGSEDFCFLLSTRAGGLGINLTTADTVIIFDSDWNPQNDLQAEARAHRIGQKKPVSVYRLVSVDTVEEQILAKAKEKLVLGHLVIEKQQAAKGKEPVVAIHDASPRPMLTRRASGRVGTSSGQAAAVGPSKEEIHRIVRFGAAALFARDNANKGADEAELYEKDDIGLRNLDIDAVIVEAEKSRMKEEGEEGEDEVEKKAEEKGSSFEELMGTFQMAQFKRKEVDANDKKVADEQDDDAFWKSTIPEAARTTFIEESQREYMEDAAEEKRLQKVEEEAQTVERKRKRKAQAKKEEDDDDDDDDVFEDGDDEEEEEEEEDEDDEDDEEWGASKKKKQKAKKAKKEKKEKGKKKDKKDKTKKTKKKTKKDKKEKGDKKDKKDKKKRKQRDSSATGGKGASKIPKIKRISDDRSNLLPPPAPKPVAGTNGAPTRPRLVPVALTTLSAHELAVQELSLETPAVKARCEVKLAAVRLTLRKLKNLPTWSETKEDDMVIQKIARYVVELGQCIGEQCMAGKGASGLYKGVAPAPVARLYDASPSAATPRQAGEAPKGFGDSGVDDGLGDVAAEDWAPVLWEYSAGFTPLEPAHLATMYMDIVKHCEKCDREQRDTELKEQKRERQRQEDERKRGRDSWSRDGGGRDRGRGRELDRSNDRGGASRDGSREGSRDRGGSRDGSVDRGRGWSAERGSRDRGGRGMSWDRGDTKRDRDRMPPRPNSTNTSTRAIPHHKQREIERAHEKERNADTVRQYNNRNSSPSNGGAAGKFNHDWERQLPPPPPPPPVVDTQGRAHAKLEEREDGEATPRFVR
jgi:superfamily II DNA/RNA helicase